VGLLLAFLTLALPAFARPASTVAPPVPRAAAKAKARPRYGVVSSAIKPKPAVVSRRAARAAARKAKAANAAAALAAKYPPEVLVAMGKRPAFFDPYDLSKPPVISAPSAIVIDADTGQVLWEKNADARCYPASTTKIMTGLLFIEHTPPDAVLMCTTPNITRIEESSLHIKPWEKFTAQDLLYGFMLRSANDAAVMIAEKVGGSVPKFADLMNERARQIGATNTHFVTPNGLHDPYHYTTARDMALIAREAMKNPRFTDAVGIPRRTIARSIQKKDTVVASKAKRHFYDKFPGADGIKTGYTRAAGHCFVGSATRDGRRLISVVFDAKSSATSDTIPALSWAFQRYPMFPFAVKDAPAPSLAVPGAAKLVPTVAGADLRAPVDALAANPRSAITTEAVPLPDVFAPVLRGQIVGSLVARDASGRVVGEVPLVAAEDVARSPVAAAVAQVPRTPAWLGGVGVLVLGWVAYRYGATSAKSARRRRGGLASARRGADRVG
jgi:D-alanyl-D-alanine carboxypeptidase (penicillin-binding protein 5/6)